MVSGVGIYDMLRVELHPNGAFNVTEFGTVKDEAQFHALYAYSPFHHVKDGTAYPAVLFTDRRQRPPRRPVPLAQDGGAPAGGDRSGSPCCCASRAMPGTGRAWRCRR